MELILPNSTFKKTHYRRHKDYRNSPKSRPRTSSAWDALEFIAWDGEGTTPEVRKFKSGHSRMGEIRVGQWYFRHIWYSPSWTRRII